jgi:hypothetical protein
VNNEFVRFCSFSPASFCALRSVHIDFCIAFVARFPFELLTSFRDSRMLDRVFEPCLALHLRFICRRAKQRKEAKASILNRVAFAFDSD